MMNRKKVEKAIYNKTPEQRKEWFRSLDDNDMIEASRMMSEIAKESPLYQESKAFRKKIEQTEKNSNKFEDIVSKETASKLMHEIKMDEHVKKLDEHHDKIVAT